MSCTCHLRLSLVMLFVMVGHLCQQSLLLRLQQERLDIQVLLEHKRAAHLTCASRSRQSLHLHIAGNTSWPNIG